MSSYPPSSSSSVGPSGSMSQGGSIFPSSQSQGNEQQIQQPDPARQLLADVAPITQALAQLAQSHPELQATVQQIGEVLKQGLNGAISQMQSPASGGQGIPSYG